MAVADLMFVAVIILGTAATAAVDELLGVLLPLPLTLPILLVLPLLVLVLLTPSDSQDLLRSRLLLQLLSGAVADAEGEALPRETLAVAAPTGVSVALEESAAESATADGAGIVLLQLSLPPPLPL